MLTWREIVCNGMYPYRCGITVGCFVFGEERGGMVWFCMELIFSFITCMNLAI